MTVASWDHTAALQRLGEDESLLVELIAIFFEGYPKLLGRLIRSLSQKDCATAADIAHSLKGSLGYLAVADAERLASDLEQASRAADFPRATALVSQLMTRIDASRQEMISSVGEQSYAPGMQ